MYICDGNPNNEPTCAMQNTSYAQGTVCEQGVCEQGACVQWFCYAGSCMWYCVSWSSQSLMSWSGMSRGVPAAIRPGLSDRVFCRVMSMVLSRLCARCMGLLCTGLLRRRCAEVCYRSPCPPAWMQCLLPCALPVARAVPSIPASRVSRSLLLLLSVVRNVLPVYTQWSAVLRASCPAVCWRPPSWPLWRLSWFLI